MEEENVIKISATGDVRCIGAVDEFFVFSHRGKSLGKAGSILLSHTNAKQLLYDCALPLASNIVHKGPCEGCMHHLKGDACGLDVVEGLSKVWGVCLATPWD